MAVSGGTAIEILLRARNQASAEINRVKGDLEGLGKAGQSAGTLGAALGGVGRAVAGLAAGWGAMQIGGMAVDLARTAAAANSLRIGFNQLAASAGQSSDQMLAAMRQASAGTISDMDLILSANKAMLLGVADTGEELAELIKVAAARGPIAGKSITSAFDDLVTGLGRESALILDNLGIVLDLDTTMNDYAATLGKTADSLTAVERKQALVNKVLRESEGLVSNLDSAAGDLQRMTTAVANMKVELGTALAPAITQGANFITGAIERLDRQSDLANRNWLIADWEKEQKKLENFQRALDKLIESSTLLGPTKREWRGVFAPREEGPSVDTATIESYRDLVEAQQAVVEEARKKAELSDWLTQPWQGGAAAVQQWRDTTVSALQIVADETRRVMSESMVPDDMASYENFVSRNRIIAEQMAADLQGSFDSLAVGMADAIDPQTALLWMRSMQEGLPEILQGWLDQNATIAEITNVLLPDYIANLEASQEAMLGMQEIMAEVAESFPGMIDTFSQLGQDDATQLLSAIESAQNQLYNIAQDSLASLGDEGALQWLKGAEKSIQLQIQAWLQLRYPIEYITNVLLPEHIDKLQKSRVEANKAATALVSMASRGGTALSGLTARIQNIVSGLVSVGVAASRAGAAIAGMNAKAIGGMSEAAKKLRTSNEWAIPYQGIAAPEDFVGMAISNGGGGGGGGGGGIDAVEQMFGDLAGRVRSVLDSALDSGIDIEKMLPREDTIQEDARRLADVAVRGYESPWADYFKNEFPAMWQELTAGGDIKAAAAQILRDFEDGLRPELLDKDRAKELVRRAILGDQNMADLANEIAAELSAELGMPLADVQARAAEALGSVGGGTDTAGAFAEGMRSKIDGTAIVQSLNSTLQLADNLTLIYNTGGNYGKRWGDGFLAVVGSNVPPALVALLATLVTPNVQAALASQASRQGATS